MCADQRRVCGAFAVCQDSPAGTACVCLPGYRDDGKSCTPTAALPPPIALDKIPSGEGCWYASLNRSAGSAAGKSFVLAAAHRYCANRVDRVLSYSSTDGAQWSVETVFTNDYAAAPGEGPRAVGIAGMLSAAVDGDGVIHAMFENREASSFSSPGQGYHGWRAPEGWSVTPDAIDDGAVQANEMNHHGTGLSGLTLSLAFQSASNRLHVIGADQARFATRWNVLEASAAAPWVFSQADAIATVANGTPDHRAVASADQDFDAQLGVQAWLDKSQCSIAGREWAAGRFADVAELSPLGFPACTSDASADYGFDADLQVLFRAGELHLFAFARAATGSGDDAPRTLIWLSRIDGSWRRASADWTGFTLQRAFVTGDGRLAILRYDARNRGLEAYWPDSAKASPLGTSAFPLVQLDLPRRAPGLVVVVEAGEFGQRLGVSALHLELVPPGG